MKTHSQSWWIGKLAVAEEDRFPVSLWEVLVWFCQLTGGPYSHWVPGGNHRCFLHLITIKPHMLLPDWDITEPEQKWTLFPQHLGPIIQDRDSWDVNEGMLMKNSPACACTGGRTSAWSWPPGIPHSRPLHPGYTYTEPPTQWRDHILTGTQTQSRFS